MQLYKKKEICKLYNQHILKKDLEITFKFLKTQTIVRFHAECITVLKGQAI